MRNKIKLFVFTTLFLLVSAISRSQVVTITPEFATQTDVITVTFDAGKGNGELSGQSVVYAHTGVITDQSSSPNDWRHVQGNWGTDDAKVKMVSVGNNKFTLTFQINSFYGITGTEKVLKLAFVFRNLAGTLVGRNTDGSDIFVPVSDGSFQINFNTSPEGNPPIIGLQDSITTVVSVSSTASVELYLNNILQSSATSAGPFPLQVKGISTGYGKQWIKVKATAGSAVYADSFYYIVRPSGASSVGVPPAGIVDGINYINDTTVVLQLFAPHKNYVYAVGEFNNWAPEPAYEMTRTPDGNRYWITISHLTKGKEYPFQYWIDKGMLKIADPYSDKFLDGNNDQFIDSITYPNLIPYPKGKTSEYVSVLQTGKIPYPWQYSNNFEKPDSNKLVIYELLIRDFIGRHNYTTLIDTLDYLEKLGINAIELMPVNEFEGNESWGYNTAFYFAPDKYYGSSDQLKLFIDECHKRGIAVITDVVLNHSFGQSSMVRMYFDATTGKPAANNPWFNADATHPYNVGYDFNHESIYTQALTDTVLKYWVREFKVDGFRFDLSKGFTQKNSGSDVNSWSAYDQTRINIWKRIYDQFRPTCSDCYMILEHFAENAEEKVLSDYGFMLWGNANKSFNEATMGYTSDLSYVSYKERTWSKPHLVAYMESHDEERLMYKNITYGNNVPGYNAKDLRTGLARCEAAACLFIPQPGPVMIWQFGELGYDISIDQNGRTGNKPIKWDYYTNSARRHLYDVYAALIHLKTTEPAFSTSDFSYSLSGLVKNLKLNHADMKVMIVANMGMTSASSPLTFQQGGKWYHYFTGDSITLLSPDTTLQLKAGEYRLYTTKKLPQPDLTVITSLQNSYSNNRFKVYPNPAQKYITIDIPDTKATVTITDLQGKTKKQVIISNGNTIELSDLAVGLYILNIQNDIETTSIKLILTD